MAGSQSVRDGKVVISIMVIMSILILATVTSRRLVNVGLETYNGG